MLAVFVKELPWGMATQRSAFPPASACPQQRHGTWGWMQPYPLSAKGTARSQYLVRFPAYRRQGEVLNYIQGGVKPCCARPVFSK